MATCWMGLRLVRFLPWPVSTTSTYDQLGRPGVLAIRPFSSSRLSLTEFGKAIVAHKEDFSRHNPIDRWWGGTE